MWTAFREIIKEEQMVQLILLLMLSHEDQNEDTETTLSNEPVSDC